jgi:hypothetical protein
MTDRTTFDLGGTYLQIGDDGSVSPIDITKTFWEELTTGRRDIIGRWLMGAGFSRESLPNWDLHPEGECILLLLSGSIDVILEEPEGQRVIELRQPGDTSVVPRGIWHRAIFREPSNRISLVAGAGTKMRPLSSDDEQ